MRIRNGFILLSLGFCGVARAQNTSSPYSIFGLGTLQTSGFNRTTGVGSAGEAYRSDNNLIQNNPASYTALIQQMFHVEAGARGQFSSYTGAIFSNSTPTPTGPTSSSQVSNDFTISRVAFGTKVTKWWGSSMGLMPYSKVAYQFAGSTTIGNGEPATAVYNGSGGLNKAYWGNGFALGKHFSVGATTSFIFGPLQSSETVTAPTANASVTSARNLYLRNINFDFGAQYYTQFGHEKQWGLVLGATYAPMQKLEAADSLAVAVGPAFVNDALLDRNWFDIPQEFGGGFALSRQGEMRKVTFLGEYRKQLWTPLGYKGTGYSLQNSDRYSAGIEISKQRNIFNTPVEHVYYQLGGYYGHTYLNLYGAPVVEWGTTVGLGVNPLRYPQWGYVLALEAGATSNYQQNSIKETFVRLSLTIHYWDRWFTRGRKQM